MRQAIKVNVSALMYSWASSDVLSGLAKLMLRAFGKQIITVTRKNQPVDETPLHLGCTYDVEGPHWNSHPPLRHSGLFPPINYRIHEDAITTPYSTCVLTSETLHVPSSVYNDLNRVQTDFAGLCKINERYSFRRTKANISMPNAINVFGAGASNWYHFALECLPKLYLLRLLPREFDNWPLLAPIECKNEQSFKSALAAVAGDRPVKYYEPSQFVHANKVLTIDEVNICPYNLKTGCWPLVSDYCFHTEALLSYINFFRGQFSLRGANKSKSRRIFLARPQSRRRFNQDALYEIASAAGYEKVFPEQLSLQDQARLFSESSHVVGASGAAWVGLIFREQQLAGLSWLPQVYDQFSAYSSLASMLGHKLNFVEAKTSSPILSTDEAFWADYHVDPDEFDAALKRID